VPTRLGEQTVLKLTDGIQSKYKESAYEHHKIQM